MTIHLTSSNSCFVKFLPYTNWLRALLLYLSLYMGINTSYVTLTIRDKVLNSNFAPSDQSISTC